MANDLFSGMSISDKVAGGYLTPSEGAALSGAQTVQTTSNIKDGIAVRDYSNPNDVYYRLYGTPAPYVGAEASDANRAKIFENTPTTFAQAQNYTKARDTMEAVEHTADVLRSQSNADHTIGLSAVIDTQGGLRLPGSGELVSKSDIKDAQALLSPSKTGESPFVSSNLSDAQLDKIMSVQSSTAADRSRDMSGSINILNEVGKLGTVDPYISNKFSFINSLGGAGDSIYGPTQTPSDKDIKQVLAYTGTSAIPIDYTKLTLSQDGTTATNIVTQQKYSTKDNKLTPIGSFGAKQNTRKTTKKSRSDSNQYSSGFMGLLTELNHPKKQKRTIVNSNKKEIVDTWSEFALINKPISNTKHSIIKLKTPKLIKASKSSSVWGEIMNMDKKTTPKKKDKKSYSAWEHVLRRD